MQVDGSSARVHSREGARVLGPADHGTGRHSQVAGSVILLYTDPVPTWAPAGGILLLGAYLLPHPGLRHPKKEAA